MSKAMSSVDPKRIASKYNDAPILRSLRGVLKKADVDDYKRYLEEKFVR